MRAKAKKITRKKLYEKVWSKPMIAICKEYGLSDVGMAKLCRRHEIPRPPRGYWARVEHGQKPPRSELPRPEDDPTIEIHPTWIDHALATHIRRQAESAMDGLVSVEPRPDLSGCHQLVAQAQAAITACKASPDGLCRLPGNAPLNMRVSQAEPGRALRLMDALLRAMEAQGWTIGAGPEVSVLGESITFRMWEDAVHVTEEPEEPDLSGPYRFQHSRQIKKIVPSGRLSLEIEGSCPSGCRHKWGDATLQRLEDILSEVLRSMVVIAARRKQWALEARRDEKRRKEARRLAKLEWEKQVGLKKEIIAEKAKVAALMREAKVWRKSQELRAYIEDRKRRHLTEGKSGAVDAEFEQWHRWAVAQADRLDPLSPSPPSVLDKETPDIMDVDEDREPYYWE
jgi:hypothetical protein